MKIRTLDAKLLTHRCGHHELDDIVTIVVEAFHDLPDSTYLVPPPGQRPRIIAAYVNLVGQLLATRGAVFDVIDNPDGTIAATAVWIRNPLAVPLTPYEHQAMMDAVGPYAPRFAAIHARFHEANQPNEDHIELAWIAVRPLQQRQGYGSALLAHRHAAIDTVTPALPCRLTCTTAAARDLYIRHGYRVSVVGEIPRDWEMEAASPLGEEPRRPFWVMRRPPQGRRPGITPPGNIQTATMPLQ